VRRIRTPRAGFAQTLSANRLPQYLDFLVSDGPRSQGEAEFTGALRHALNEHLGPRGWVRQIADNITNSGYRILVEDREKREIAFGFSFDEAINLGEGPGGEKGMFDRVVALCIQRLKEAMFANSAEGAPSGSA
jgi:hypothetical protein